MSDTLRRLTGLFVQIETPPSTRKADAAARAELERSLTEEFSLGPPKQPPPQPQPVTALSLEQLFAQAQIPAVPFSAEKLLKVLDSLKAPPDVQRSAVQAMTAAGDWTIDSVVQDAQAKIAAIQSAQARRKNESQAAKENRLKKIADQQTYLKAASEEIQKQIAALQQTLHEEEASVKNQIQQLENEVTLEAEQCNAQLQEMTEQEKRFQGIVNLFEVPAHE